MPSHNLTTIIVTSNGVAKRPSPALEKHIINSQMTVGEAAKLISRTGNDVPIKLADFFEAQYIMATSYGVLMIDEQGYWVLPSKCIDGIECLAEKV